MSKLAALLVVAALASSCTGMMIEELEATPGEAGVALINYAYASSAPADLTGFSVVSSDDGRYVMVGSPGVGSAKDGIKAMGMWILWERNSTGGYDKLAYGTGGTNGGFSGYSMAMSGDGSVLAVGTPALDNRSPGSLQIYVRPRDGWKKNAYVKPDWDLAFGDMGDWLGYSVAMDANADIIAFGLVKNDGVGKVHYLLKPEGGWANTKAKLEGGYLGQGGLSADAMWGYSVAVSRDGSRIAVGAPYNGGVGMFSLYERPETGWQDVEMVRGFAFKDLPQGARLGYRVALSDDGTTILATAPGYAGGTVFIVATTGTGSELKTDVTALGPDGEFAYGVSVAISGDASRFVVGATGRQRDGKVYVYTGTPGDPDSYEYLKSWVPSVTGGMYGFSVAMDRPGDTVFIGIPRMEKYVGDWDFISFSK